MFESDGRHFMPGLVVLCILILDDWNELMVDTETEVCDVEALKNPRSTTLMFAPVVRGLLAETVAALLLILYRQSPCWLLACLVASQSAGGCDVSFCGRHERAEIP